MKSQLKLLACLLLASALCLSARAQGSLTPPAAPAPTMKTLDQIEARTPISAVPFTITTGGSFYLTGNLFAGAAQSGITIQADNVTLDLNGFSLANTNTGLSGINVQTVQRNLVIRNGTLRGWGTAVEARITTACTFSDLQILTNGLGLKAGTNSVVRNCLAANNGTDGIAVLDGSTITGCKTFGNGRFGLVATTGVLINLTSASSNSNSGMSITGTNNLLRDCLVWANAISGIVSGGQNRIIACSSCANGSRGIDQGLGQGDWVEGCTVSGNVFGGIFSVGHAATLLNNTVSGNGGVGISVSGDSGVIDGNSILSNGGATGNGLVVGAGNGTNNLIIRNRASGQLINYVISVTSRDAQRLTPGSNFVSTDPLANLSY